VYDANVDVTLIQLTRGHDGSGKPVAGLTPDQRAGKACLGCGQSGADTRVGWIGGTTPVFIHSWCVNAWRDLPRAR